MRAYIVSHTHWDREWYETFHRFRVRLVRIVSQVLDRLETDDAFEHFLLDGQAVLLEDHLEARPGDEERIRRLVCAGALSIGPWYVLPDEFLVSGESTVRNLLMGDTVCRRFGGARKEGYMPDSFGHVAQMPQILRRAGIDSFVYTRGNGDEIEELGHEYLWRAPDGSEVLAINQCEGYCSAGGLGFQELWHAHTRRRPDPALAVEQIRELFGKMARLGNGDIVLVNNGCDHLPPQREIGAILAALREAFPETEFLHTGLREYVVAVRAAGFAAKTFAGELLGGRHHFILSGVWSARIYLKQRNEGAETLLANVVEPVLARARFGMGLPWPGGLIDLAWKELLRNHPHDSICGCSTDDVHRDMMARFDAVDRTGEELLREHLDHLCPSFGREEADDRETVVAALNPLPALRTAVIDRMVVLQPLCDAVEDSLLLDESGRPVPFEIVEQRYVERFWGIDHRSELTGAAQEELFATWLDHHAGRILEGPEDREESDCHATIRFLAEDLPAVGHRLYRLAPRGEGPAPAPVGEVEVTRNTLSNRHLSVTLHPNGTFDLRHAATGAEYPGLGLLSDVEDVGDEYDHSPAEASATVTAADADGRLRVIDGGGLRGTLEARFFLPLPLRIETDRRRRSDRVVPCEVRTRVSLDHGSRFLDVEVAFVNRAEDHRLSMEFPAQIPADTVWCDGQFLVNERPAAPPAGIDWAQPPPGTLPQQGFCAVEDGKRGLAVLNRGLPEIRSLTGDDGGTGISVTLLRCVGWLSRDDFPTRNRSNAGPTLPTPGAQCPGEHRFRLAVMPYAGSWLGAGVLEESARFRCPVLTKQGVADQSVPGDGSFLEVAPGSVAVTAVKRHRDRDTLVVRLVNHADEPRTATIRCGVPILGAWRTSLLEERLDAMPAGDGPVVTAVLCPHEIATLEMELEGRGERAWV